MPLYKPSELMAFLHCHHLRPNKNLSQNFIIDGNVLDKMVADVVPEDVVIEIGPGPGALTEKLLEKGCRVIAVEKDRLFADALFKHERLQVYHADALEFSFGQHITKVVSNLPYNVTSPILERLVQLPIKQCVVMIQEDAARRFLEGRDYTSLFLHYHASIEYGFKVSRGSFYPKPAVDSAVIKLVMNKRYPVFNEKQFFVFLHIAFLQRRKMIKSSIKSYPIELALQKIKKPSTSRPEELSLEEWVQLYNASCE